MLILGLDFETTITEPVMPKEMRIIEIGAVLWDSVRKYPVLPITRLVWDKSYPFVPFITELTGLTLADLEKYGTPPKYALEKLLKLMREAEAVVAHNGKFFDKPLLEAECARHGLAMPELPWIDTVCDIDYPKKIETRKLDFLAPSHGFINPFAHRAMFDVLSMMKILSNYDFDYILARSKEPEIVIKALVQKPFGPTAEQGKKETDQAKARGFRFDGESKSWLKRIKEVDYQMEVGACPFRIAILEQKK